MKDVVIAVPVSELVDRVTILELKLERIADAAKRERVHAHLAALERARTALPWSPRLHALAAELAAINARLWNTEDELRLCEAAADFGDRFVALARSVYIDNDARAAVKRAIDELVGSSYTEEKSYAGMPAVMPPPS